MEAKKRKEIEDKEQKIRDDELKRIAVCFILLMYLKFCYVLAETGFEYANI